MNMVSVVVQSFGGIVNVCWRLLNIKCIADTYSLWNVFQGVFACWAFKVMIVDNVLQYSGRSFHSSYGIKKRSNRNQVNRKEFD